MRLDPLDPAGTDRRCADLPRTTPAPLRALAVTGTAVTAACLALLVAGPSGVVRGLVLVTLSVVTAAAVVRATTLLRPARGARCWTALAGAVLLSGAGWACALLLPALGVAVPPWPGELAAAASTAVSVVCLVPLVGLRRSRDRLAAIDTAVVAVALGVLVWALVDSASAGVDLPTSTRTLAALLPALDLLLVAFALRLVLVGGADLRTGLLLGWAATRGIADGAWSWQVLHGEAPLGVPVLALHVVSVGLLGLSAAVPAGVLRRPGRPDPTAVGPTVVLLAVLPLPVLLAVRALQGSAEGVLVVAAGSAVVTVLVVGRALLSSTPRASTGAGRAVLRLVAAFLVLALLPLAGLTSFAVSESHRAMDEEVTDRMRVTAAVSAEYVREELSSVETLVASYADRRLLAAVVAPRAPAERTELDRQLGLLAAAHPDVDSARLLDLRGRVVRTSPPGTSPGPDPDLARAALASRASHVSPSFAVGQDRQRAVSVAVAIRRADGRPLAVLAVRYRLAALEAFAQHLAAVQGVHLTVADQRGRALTAETTADRTQRPAVAAALAGRTGTVEDARTILSYQPVGERGWAVTSSVPTAVAFAAGDVLRARLVAGAVLLAQLLLVGMVLGVRSDLRRRAAQAALAEREAHLASVLEAAGDAFVSVDARGRITAWNAAAARLYRRARDEVLGQSAGEVLVPTDSRAALEACAATVLSSGQTSRAELVSVDASGRTFPAELTVWRSGAPQSPAVHCFVRDLTERRRAEAELAVAHDAALEASRLKSEFVATMSHEIRTPMNGVLGMTSLLRATALSPVQRDYADTIGSCAETLLNVIDDVLDFSKIEAGRLDLEAVDFELRPLVEDVVSLLGGSARGRGLEVVAWIDPALPRGLHGDPHRLRQVLSNLVGNAVKYTERGEVVVHVEPSPAGAPGVRFSVRDTGIGISAEQRVRLFEPFQQAEASTTRKYGGTGLGLTISRQLVELLGGTLDVESRPGAGSTFWFEVPLPAALAPTPAPRRRRFDDVRALVVDDNATHRLVLDQYLSAWAVQTTCAADADTALRLLREAAAAGRPFHLALLDRDMPGTDGLDLARAVSAAPALAGVRLAVLSSHDDAGDRAAATGAGIHAFLLKPVREARLLDCLGRLLGEDVVVPAQAGPDDAPRRRPGRVLLAEDNAVNQQVALAMLESLGFAADVACDGREAVEMLRAGSYAAVLMDCQMPRLDGFAATREIRDGGGDAARTPVIALTASALAADRERCLAAGMDDFVSKPLRRDKLTAALDRWIAPAAVRDVAVPVLDGAVLDGAVLDGAVLGELQELAGEHWPALVEDYLEELPGQLAELAACAAAGDRVRLAAVAHVVKGSSGAMAAHRLAAAADALEAGAAAGAAVGELVRDLERQATAATTALRARLPVTRAG